MNQTPVTENPDGSSGLDDLEPVLCIVGACVFKLWGDTPGERLKKQFAQHGIAKTVTLTQAGNHPGRVILVRADAVLDQPLIPVLAKRPNFMLLSGEPLPRPLAVCVHGRDVEAGHSLLRDGLDHPPAQPVLMARTPGELDAGFWKGLRKREIPYALVLTADNGEQVAWRMFMGTYKGATDFVTKHVWPRPAYAATRFLAPRGVTPNMVTTVGAVFMVAAFFLFLWGHYWTGLAAAWAMTFLDTVDGKLARTTLTSSKWGDMFDHGIDLVHPPFWYAAWALGLASAGFEWSSATFWWVLAAILAGYVLQRLIEGIAIKWLGLEIHIWRRIDTHFRQITARRNPNLAILTWSMIMARPDLGLMAVAWWTVICLVLHGLQLAQAFIAKGRDGQLVSWMSER